MEQASNVKSLSDRIKAKTQQDREQVENLTQHELQKLGESLRQQSAAELRTTEDAISGRAQQLRESTSRTMQETGAEISRQTESLKDTSGRLLEQTGAEMRRQAESAGKTWVLQVQAGVQGTIRPIQATMDSARYSAEAAQRNAENLAESLAKLETSAQATRAVLIRTTAFPLLVALLTLLAICGIAWGVMQWQYKTIQEQAAEIAQQRETLRSLPRGIDFVPESKVNGGKPLLMLPKGVNMTTTCGNRPCVLLE